MTRALLAAVALACAGCGGCPVQPGDSEDAGDDVAVPDAGPRHRYASLEIAPRDVELQTSPGVAVTQAFTLTGITHDGAREPISNAAQWSVVEQRVGTIDETGLFRADGLVAGMVTIEALATDEHGLELRTSTSITVSVHGSVGTGERFDGTTLSPDAAGAVEITYPLDGVMVPRNLASPDVQWRGSVEGDAFRISLCRGHASVDVFSVDGAHLQLDPTTWRVMTASDPGERLTITIDRLPAGANAYHRSAPVEMRIARGSVYGLVYFWQLSPGRILRINAETAERDAFMGTPPAYPPGSEACVACHSVSPNGRWLAGQVSSPNARKGSIFDLTSDLSASPAPTLYPINRVPWGPSSFSPDSTLLVVSSMPGLQIIDPLAGATVATEGLPTTAANHPAWAPDGSGIAYIATDSTWSHEFEMGDLMLAPKTGANTFGPSMRLHTGAALSSSPEGGSADLRPSWSPDARYIAFAHGRQTSDPHDGGLYLIKRDGSGLVRLDRVSGHAFWPSFSPFTTEEDDGTYYWMGFYSRQAYGNATGDVRQLWVTAIRADAPGGEDPSNVPYWLPGQDPSTHNIAGQWAAAACRPSKDECSVDGECCSGRCVDELCEMPLQCRAQGRTCGAAAECCDGLACVANICSSG